MDYIVFDLEWNQPTQWNETVVSPCFLPGEIVQIGAVKLNEHFETVSELRVYVKPIYYPKMHRKIAALTGVYDRDLEQKGLPFPEAFRMFVNWCGDEFTFMTWSESDVPMLVHNMRIHGMSVADFPDMVDLQRVFGKEIMRTDRLISLEEAMATLRIQGDRAHDALNDAKNTVRVCDRMDLESCIDAYITRMYVDETPHRMYPNKKELLEDPELLRIACPWCGEVMTGEGWSAHTKNGRISMATCAEGDEFLIRLSWYHVGEQICVERALYDMSDDLWDRFGEKIDAYVCYTA